MKKLVYLTSALIGLSAWGKYYVVKPGETLSQIVQKNFSEGRIFGPRGNLQKVTRANPKITDQNKIYPGQEIFLPDTSTAETRTTASEDVVPASPELPQVFIDEWTISLLYGAKFISINQSSDALGNAALGILFLDDVKVQSEYRHGPWAFNVKFNTYKFKYQTQTSSDSKTLSALDLGLGYSWFTAGLSSEQIPIFDNSSVFTLHPETLTSVKIGVRKNIEVQSVRKPTQIQLQAGLSYPLSGSSGNPEIKFSKISGLGGYGHAALTRVITQKEDYTLRAILQTDVNYKKINQDIEVGSTSGDTKNQVLDISTAIGLQFGF